MVVSEEFVTYGNRAEEAIQVVEPVYRASSIAWFITLVIELTLVKTMLVLYLLNKASSLVGVSILSTLLLVNLNSWAYKFP